MSGKPDDIPQDVWDKAMAVAAEMEVHAALSTTTAAKGQVIARAIMAEREACARQAEAEQLNGDIPAGTTVRDVKIMIAMVEETAKSIAAAIRQRGEG